MLQTIPSLAPSTVQPFSLPTSQTNSKYVTRSQTATNDDFFKETSPSMSNIIPNEEVDSNLCQICYIRHGSDKDIDSPWVGCSYKGCNFWVHSLCSGYQTKDDQVEGMGKFYCPKHIRRPLITAKRRIIKK